MKKISRLFLLLLWQLHPKVELPSNTHTQNGPFRFIFQQWKGEISKLRTKKKAKDEKTT